METLLNRVLKNWYPLEEFENILDSKNIDERDVFATASMRKINNPDEVIAKVKDKLGISIEIISG